jgi:MFS family permease
LSKRGGYDSPKAVYWVFLFSCIGIGSALSIPFLTDFYWSASALWIVLFFGGAMMPGLTGIMMASVPPYLRAFGNSTGEIIKNCFGYLPAPFIYGWFNQLFDTDKAGIKVLMFWGLWAPILLGFGSLYRFRQLKHLDMKRVRKNSYEQKARKLSGLMDKEDEVSVDFSGELKVEEEAALISEYLAEKEQGEVVGGDSKE